MRIRKKNLWREKIICILFVCFLCGMVELSVRIIFPKEDELSRILNVLEQDSVLFWRLRPKLNVIFQGVKVKTNSLGLRIKDGKDEFKENKKPFRIICLGGSPTFGWGIRAEDSYPYQLEKIFKQEYGLSRNVKVINAGIIGYTSYQGLAFLKNQILKLSPDLITVSYLVNDIDKYRFYRNSSKEDKEVNSKSKILVFLENIFARSKFFRILKGVILKANGVNTKFYGKAKSVYPENRRVSPEDYRKNLNAFIDTARQNNIEVVLIKMKVLSLFSGRQIVDSFKDKADRYIYRGLDYAKQAKYNKAIAEIENALEYNPYSAKAFYHLGLCFAKKKEFEKSEIYFQKAKEMELFACARLSRIYNQIMEQVAAENEVPLIDIVSAFEAFTKGDGRGLFVSPNHDFVHPNAIGHKIISEEIANLLTKSNLLVED